MDTTVVKVPIGGLGSDFVLVDVDPELRVEIDHTKLVEDEVMLASGQPQRAIITASESFEQSLDRIVTAIGGALIRIRSLPDGPDATEIEFGLRVGGEVGVVVARGTADVNFRVKLSWESGSSDRRH